MSDIQDEFTELFERSKDDHLSKMIVGSEVRRCIGRIWDQNARIRELEEAVRVLAELSYYQGERERVLKMDPDHNKPEVIEMALRNGPRLIRAMAAASDNPTARDAIKRAGESKGQA